VNAPLMSSAFVSDYNPVDSDPNERCLRGMSMLGTLITIHGLIRWILAALAIVLIVRYGLGWLGRRSFAPVDRQLGRGYAVAMTVQFVLGAVNLALLALNGAFRPAVHIEHAFYGLLATALAHMAPALKSERRYRDALILVIVSLVLVFFSVVRLRGNFFFGLT